ncbi:hypothetical protein DFH06DRAFT_1332301 [Mycena polygramma]|nr:hypothetical protein DFH06DRAFT_1332301 [Mycena polygramma]
MRTLAPAGYVAQTEREKDEDLAAWSLPNTRMRSRTHPSCGTVSARTSPTLAHLGRSQAALLITSVICAWTHRERPTLDASRLDLIQSTGGGSGERGARTLPHSTLVVAAAAGTPSHAPRFVRDETAAQNSRSDVPRCRPRARCRPLPQPTPASTSSRAPPVHHDRASSLRPHPRAQLLRQHAAPSLPLTVSRARAHFGCFTCDTRTPSSSSPSAALKSRAATPNASASIAPVESPGRVTATTLTARASDDSQFRARDALAAAEDLGMSLLPTTPPASRAPTRTPASRLPRAPAWNQLAHAPLHLPL